MNQLIGSEMFDSSDVNSHNLQRLITLPMYSVVNKENKSKKDGDDQEPCDQYKKLQNEASSSESNTTEEMELASVDLKSPDQKRRGKYKLYLDKERLNLALHPVPEKQEIHKEAFGLPAEREKRSACEMSDSSAIVHELLEIVDAESAIVRRESQNKESRDDSRSEVSIPQSIVSARLKAIIENWRNDESLALSSNDSWSLRSEAGRERRTPLPRDEYHHGVESEGLENMPQNRSQQHQVLAQMPIRQRLRESWRTNELKKQYIRKISLECNQRSDPDKVSNSNASAVKGGVNHSYPDHLLPHPDDLMLVSRNSLDQEHEIGSGSLIEQEHTFKISPNRKK